MERLFALREPLLVAPPGAAGWARLREKEPALPTCDHLTATPLTPAPAGSTPVCTDCVPVGGRWVHLRRCLSCDHVACCDSSPARHATAHAHATGHPVITSAEPGEAWRWCYVDEVGA